MGLRRLTLADAISIREQYSAGVQVNSLADQYLVAPETIRRVIRRDTHRHALGKIEASGGFEGMVKRLEATQRLKDETAAALGGVTRPKQKVSQRFFDQANALGLSGLENYVVASEEELAQQRAEMERAEIPSPYPDEEPSQGE